VSLRPRHRRLARYLYAAPLVRIRRVLDIGGDAEGGALLSQHGARSVLVLQTEGADRSAALKPGDGVTVRSVSRSDLARGLRAQAGPSEFDVVFLRATPDLFTPAFLSELRGIVAKNGHVVVSARSREAGDKTPGPDALGYFDLLDGLNQAGFGPVTMLGQSAFLGSALMPYGASEPPLVFDDTLSPPDGAEEYVALCGAVPSGGLPYQIIKLSPQALDLPALIPGEKVVERVADPEVVAERDRLKARLDALRSEQEGQKAELQAAQKATRALEDRLRLTAVEAEAQRQEATGLRQKQDEMHAALRSSEAQRGELSERLRQRDRSDAEAATAAVLHERQMRELRTQLEERDAFVSELEEQLRDLPRFQEKLISAERQADEAQRRERQARQKLAELDGQLLRARGELSQIAGDKQLSLELETRQREIEAARREVLMGRDAIEQAEQALALQKSELSRAQQALDSERAELGKLRSEKAAAERAVSDRDVALAEARKELLAVKERLQETYAELEQRTQVLVQTQGELQRSRERASMVPVLADGVPVLVGDLPTAPQALHGQFGSQAPALSGKGEDAVALRQRVTELLAENERLKDKLSDAERETWKHMKARSEAEQAAAEVREDTVRKLRDARKLASVELTRAMEDATKKAVQLREELARTETERKDAVQQAKELRAERDGLSAQIGTLKQELDSLRRPGAISTPPLVDDRLRVQLEQAQLALGSERAARQAAQQNADEAQVRAAELRKALGALETSLAETQGRVEREKRRADTLEEELRAAREGLSRAGSVGVSPLQLQQDLQQRERLLAERTAERDALGRLLAEVEREAAARAERARTLRVRLSEREREVEVLRAELLDRDRKLTALEQQMPPSEELARLSGELQAARRRISELLDEAARRDQHGDDAVATALRERARAVRMGEALDQMTRERDEAKSRSSDLEQRLTDAISESERLHGELMRLSSLGSDSKL
jgi:chromosome segregation ATPase